MSFVCNRCGGIIANLHVTEWYEVYLSALLDLSAFQNLADPSTEDLLRQLTLAVADATRERRPAIPVNLMQLSKYPWVSLRCAQCERVGLSGTEMDLSSQIYRAFSEEARQLEIKYCSLALGIDLRVVDPMMDYGPWHKIVDDVLKTKHQAEYEHIERFRELQGLFAPDRGGGGNGYGALLYLLSIIASGIATNFIYDLMKLGVVKVRKQIVRIDARMESKKAMARLSDPTGIDLFATPKPSNSYSADILSVIASMPRKKRRRVIDQIAQQHAKNVKSLLIKTIEKSSTDKKL